MQQQQQQQQQQLRVQGSVVREGGKGGGEGKIPTCGVLWRDIVLFYGTYDVPIAVG